MFCSPPLIITEPTTIADLPPIIKQVTTDANGLAYFDLNALIVSTIPYTYYFEAFETVEDGYLWKSVIHPSFELKKGMMVTDIILVN